MAGNELKSKVFVEFVGFVDASIGGSRLSMMGGCRRWKVG